MKGPPTLFVKAATNHVKKVYAIAFRNGTERVSTAISSIHRNHHWEGIALIQKEVLEYQENEACFFRKCITRIESPEIQSEELLEESDLIDEIYDEKINPLTVRQGK